MKDGGNTECLGRRYWSESTWAVWKGRCLILLGNDTAEMDPALLGIRLGDQKLSTNLRQIHKAASELEVVLGSRETAIEPSFAKDAGWFVLD